MASVSSHQRYKGSILFINRDAKNVLKRDKAEAFAVNSHVSGTYRHWLRNERIGQFTSAYRHWFRNERMGQVLSTEPTPTAVNSERDVTYTDTEKAFHRATSRDRFSDQTDETAPASINDRRFAGSRSTVGDQYRSGGLQKTSTGQSESALHSMARKTPSPQTIINGGNSDPFNAAATPITPFHSELINNWEHRYSYYLTPLGASSSARRTSARTWRYEVQQSIEHEILLHGIFAGALVSLSTHPEFSALELRRRATFHQGRCLRLIRKSVSQGKISAQLLEAVAYAAVADFFRRDIPACEVHIQAMKMLTEMQGGLQQLPAAFRPKLILSDLEIADSTLCRTRFHVSTWDVPDWDTQGFAASMAYKSMVEESEQIGYHDTLPHNIKIILRQHREAILVHRLASSLAQIDEAAADGIFYWLHTRKFALMASSLDAYYDHLESSNPSSIEASLPLAANYCQRLIIDARYENIAGIPIHNLRNSLGTMVTEHILDVEDEWLQKCLLWILFVGACVESFLLTTTPTTETWFIDKFVTLRKHMWFTSVDAVDCFQQFLYDEKSLGLILHRLFT